MPEMSKPILDDLFTFSGRRDRKSYALLHLALYGIGACLGMIILILDEVLGGTGMMGVLLVVVLFLLISVITLITSAQRCRDAGVSGTAGLAVLLPLGFITLMLWPGEKGKNKFGEDPREKVK